MRRIIALASVLFGACASGDADQQARLHKLEVEVAELRGRVEQMGHDDFMASSRCRKTIDVTIPEGTQMTMPVAFDVGRTNTRPGDRITITEISGTRPDFAIGGTYLVRGEYTLASADEAVLGFSVTALDPGDGCTSGNPRGKVHITRGSGKFELANPIAYRGHPHVSFYVHGEGSGGVYFGKGDFLEQ